MMTNDPIRAIRFDSTEQFKETELAGSYYLDLTHDRFWFFCPCGCGARSAIRIGKREKPEPSPSWLWNGSLNDPDLSPSIRQLVCGWHGWLSDGYWIPAPDSGANRLQPDREGEAA